MLPHVLHALSCPNQSVRQGCCAMRRRLMLFPLQETLRNGWVLAAHTVSTQAGGSVWVCCWSMRAVSSSCAACLRRGVDSGVLVGAVAAGVVELVHRLVEQHRHDRQHLLQ